MDFTLSAADVAVQERARKFATEVLAPRARAADEQGVFDHDVLRLFGATGLLGAQLPKDLGGSGFSHVQFALSMIELGAVDSSWRGFGTVQSALCGQMILHNASAAQRAAWLPELATGRAVFAFALTEPEAGSDVAALSTRAVADGDGWRLQGEKCWITNGGIADWIFVFATVDPALGRKGLSCFAVRGNAQGVRRERMEGIELGHRGADHARIHLDGVRVNANDLLGAQGAGFAVAMSGLEHGRLGVAAGAVGIQQGCFDACLSFARERRQFGKRIGDFQLIQKELADMHVDLESTRLLTLRAAALRDAGQPNLHEVSVAKYAACEAAVRSANAAVLMFGSRGYSSAAPVGRFLRDAKGLQIYEGTAHIQSLIIGRGLMGRDSAEQDQRK
ncbi:MAG: acyl-CoA dehydrogenase [Planctomycetes bacterium]|nr:acyl-CoA dehydrogenase [Planctomycetota bacterium]